MLVKMLKLQLRDLNYTVTSTEVSIFYPSISKIDKGALLRNDSSLLAASQLFLIAKLALLKWRFVVYLEGSH